MSIVVTADHPAVGLRTTNTGASADSTTLSRELAKALYRLPTSRSALLDELVDVYMRCQKPGWDGYTAKPITSQSYSSAKRFLALLPETMPLPEITPERDGELALDWNPKRYWSLSVSFSNDGAISYAGIFGNKQSTSHGTEPFSETIPGVVFDLIERLTKAIRAELASSS